MSSETAGNVPSLGLLSARVLWVTGVTGVGVALLLACPERRLSHKEQI